MADGPDDRTSSPDGSLLEGGAEPVVRLTRWTGPVDEDRADAPYLHAVASSSLVDPVATAATAARHLGVPVGALVRHVLADWASAGSQALLAAGPSAMADLVAAVRAADEAAPADRAAALATLRGRAEWLAAGLEDPARTYPEGGGGRRRRRRLGAYGLATGSRGVLLVQVADGYPGAGRWTLPGGGVEHGEDPLDGVVREYLEETGLRPTLGSFLLSDSNRVVGSGGDDLHLLRLVWRVQVPDETPVVHEVDGSTAQAAWIARDRLDRVPLLSVATRALEAAGLDAPVPDRSDGAV